MATPSLTKQNMSQYCFYYLQGHPGESWSSPNAFMLLHSSPNGTTLGDCKMSFPLIGEGKFHWRFRTASADGPGFIWRDVFSDEEVLPLYQGVAFAKILRLDKLPKIAPSKIRFSQRQGAPQRAAAGASPPPPQLQQQASAAPQSQPRQPVSIVKRRQPCQNPNNHNSLSPPPSAPPTPPPIHSYQYSDDAPRQQQLPPRQNSPRPAPYSDFNSAQQAQQASRPTPAPAAPTPPSPPKPPPKPETRAERTQREYKEKAALQKKVWDPVDERWVVVSDNKNSSTSPKITPPKPVDANSLFGMVETPAATTNITSAPPEMEESNQPSARIRGVTLSAENSVGKSAAVAAAMNQRVDEMQANQAKAVQEFRDREAAAAAGADVEDEIRRRLDPKIKAWSEEYGKKRPLRALVCSMDKVLWENSGVPSVNLGDILEPAKARKAYLKASRFVHPDKTAGLDPEKRFIAKRVFDALSQANAEFTS
jgi:hypothetical protein